MPCTLTARAIRPRPSRRTESADRDTSVSVVSGTKRLAQAPGRWASPRGLAAPQRAAWEPPQAAAQRPDAALRSGHSRLASRVLRNQRDSLLRASQVTLPGGVAAGTPLGAPRSSRPAPPAASGLALHPLPGLRPASHGFERVVTPGRHALSRSGPSHSPGPESRPSSSPGARVSLRRRDTPPPRPVTDVPPQPVGRL